MKGGMDFEQFYITWYSRAKRFAREYVMSDSEAESIVHDVFVGIYERRQLFDNYTNPVAYLFTATKNRSLDFLRHRTAFLTAKEAMQSEMTMELRMKLDSLEALNVNFHDENDIEERLNRALERLPEKCRKIFVMNKLEGKRQREIAEELHISVNTVESQMAVAYRKLREELRDCIPLLLFLLYY